MYKVKVVRGKMKRRKGDDDDEEEEEEEKKEGCRTVKLC